MLSMFSAVNFIKRDCVQKTMQENFENRETDEDKESFKNATRCFICGDRSQKSCKTKRNRSVSKR